MKRPPAWTKLVATRIASNYSRQDPPPIHWRVRKAAYSTGVCYYGQYLVVTEGTFDDPRLTRIEAKLTLIHELSHWYGSPRDHHNAAFWDRYLVLCKLCRVAPRHILRHHHSHLPLGLLQAAKRAKLPGYRRALQERKCITERSAP